MRDYDDDEEFRQKVGEVVGKRLTSGLRETFIADIGMDHLPVDRVEEWMQQFDGLEDSNGLSFIYSELVPHDESSFTITGVGTVDNPTVQKWLNGEGLVSTFSFQINSHGLKDELGNLPLDVWPEYAPHGLHIQPLE